MKPFNELSKSGKQRRRTAQADPARYQAIQDSTKEWRGRNKDKVLSHGRTADAKRRSQSPERQRKCREARIARMSEQELAEFRKKQAEKSAKNRNDRKEAYTATARAGHLRRKFGLTAEQYDAMVVAQNGVCAICHKPCQNKRSKGRLSVDHDHVTGKVRALLCHLCNFGVGAMRDDSMVLRAAADYVEKWSVLHGAEPPSTLKRKPKKPKANKVVEQPTLPGVH